MNKRLIIFLKKDSSFRNWDEAGILDREVSLYERLRDRGIKISFVSYGNFDDLHYQKRLFGMEILCNRWSLPNRVYVKLLHRLHGNIIRSCHIIKTNQMNGADIALRCSLYWNKPLIARCGWMISFNQSEEFGYHSNQARSSRSLEEKVFSHAKFSVVTTDLMLKNVVERLPQLKNKICVIPNYVDEEIFFPEIKFKMKYDVIFVGRLSPEKNIESLLFGLDEKNIKLLIIGQGPLEALVLKYYGGDNPDPKYLEGQRRMGPQLVAHILIIILIILANIIYASEKKR